MRLQPAKIDAGQQGFTLLEVLVVITIVGILVGVTVLSFGATDQRRLSAEASRLKLAFEQAADAALMKQITLGWFYREEENQYRFEQLNDAGQWIKPGDTVFQSYAIDGPIELSIHQSIENSSEAPVQQRIQTKEFLREFEEDEKPQLLFFSSGEYTPFEILISDTKRSRVHIHVHIKGDGFGKIHSAMAQR